MAALGNPFRGILYAGLMLTAEGPKLIEYNVRFGDPECQVLMPRLDSDLLDLLHRASTGTLTGATAAWKDVSALTVVMATRGYPGAVEKGSQIRGVERAAAMPGVTVFHAGTASDGERLVASGGRVLDVTAIAPTLEDARARAYAAVAAIDWPEGFCRSDIGWRALG